MALEPLYRRVLGARFDDLPEVLRAFHDAPGGGRARGTLRIERARGWLQRALATILGLPRSGDDVPVRLEVQVDADRERWVREIQGRRMATVQWARGDLIMESLGPVYFSSALVTDGSRLRYEFRQAWIAGIPLPRCLAPVVEGSAEAGDCGWHVAVQIGAPIIGELVRYSG